MLLDICAVMACQEELTDILISTAAVLLKVSFGAS